MNVNRLFIFLISLWENSQKLSPPKISLAMRSGFAIVAESDGQHPDDRKTNQNEIHSKPKQN